ncbi:MAG: DUF4288 domain-containing protein [Terriglobales bacterium]
MSYMPDDAKWWIAEIVEEITVEDDARNVVHVNFNLIRADSPDEAYTKAIEFGVQGETQYDNPEGKSVRIRFCGLRNLRVICDELEHGAELFFERHIGIPPESLNEWVKPKEKLEVFVPWTPPDFTKAPDYASKEVLDEVEHRFGLKRFDGMDESHGPDHH